MSLRPLVPRDDDLIQRWLRQPDVISWWGSAGAGAAKIRLARDSSDGICRIIEVEGTPVGYAQAMDAGHLGGERPGSIPPGAVECDVFVAVPEARGRGVGPKALDGLVGEVFRSTLALACVVMVSIRHEAAARAFERLGFRWTEVWHDPALGPSWVMVRERIRP